MSSQIFKDHIPNELLIKLLDDIAVKSEKCYVLNKYATSKRTYYALLYLCAINTLEWKELTAYVIKHLYGVTVKCIHFIA